MTKEGLAENPEPGEYYDALAPDYNSIAEKAGWAEQTSALMERVFASKLGETVHSALDIGAGTGASVAGILGHAQPWRLVMVDASAEMLRRNQVVGAQPVVAKAEDFVQTCQEQFDLVTALGVLEFVPDLPMFLGCSASLLHEDGRLAFTYVPHEARAARQRIIHAVDSDKDLKEYRWQPVEVEAALKKADLEVIDKVDQLEAYKLDQDAVRYNFVIAQPR